MEKLRQYVGAFALRGACRCGKCCDGPEKPDEHQPSGHTVNLTFFKVAAKEGATLGALKEIVEAEYPGLLDHAEHNYLEIGGAIGDQGLALMLIGLGHVLGLWRALSPDTLMPFLPENLKRDMAGQGMVALNAASKEEVKAALDAAKSEVVTA